jgi:class 3 adenylate cyclase
LAILFTDIENSTNLTERLGDRLWLDVLEDHNKLVREQLMAHDCLEVKSLGDGFMIVSKSAPQALKCAISIRRELSGHNKMAKEPIRVRIGLHAGEVLRHADDFFGKHVIVAQRIAGKARGDEILASEVIKDMVRGVAGVRFGAAREVELKGLSGTFIVHPVTLR